MANILITERQLALITKDQALKNVTSINESEWYNTIGDIVGIIDPTGVVDLVNGVSYWNQGDKLFALLSWISVVPYVVHLQKVFSSKLNFAKLYFWFRFHSHNYKEQLDLKYIL